VSVAYLKFGCAARNQGAMAKMTLRDGTWLITSTSPAAVRADVPVNRVLEGTFGIDREYPGCGSCGVSSYVKCGVCSELSCWDGEPTYRCFHCGNSGPVIGPIDSASAID
jgi:hypothetical protein